MKSKHKIMINEVSCFEAGYMAGLVDSGRYNERGIELANKGLAFGNRWRHLLNSYRGQDNHDDGLKEMFAQIDIEKMI